MLQRPNLLFIMTDQQRYDVFSHRGNMHIETPNLDRLAGEGALFGQATCTYPVCGPSRAAILSGCHMFDGKYGSGNREPEGESLFLEPVTTFDEALARAGYHVEYHGKWHTGNEHLDCYRGDNRVWGHHLREYHDYLAARYERPAGDAYAVDPYSDWPFRKVPLNDVADAEASKTYAVYRKNSYGVFEIGNEDTMTAFTVDKTVRFLRSRPPGPFSVTCSILHPHLPFTPNEHYAAMFGPGTMPIPGNVDAYYKPEFNQFHGKKNRKKAIPELISADGEGLGQFLALYYALIKEIDDHVGRLLDVLAEEGHDRNTLVIFTSDHGDMGGSHNSFAKCAFYEESLRVPLIMRYPEGIDPGMVLDCPATGADLAPTILDYCGVPALAQFHGGSLRPPLEGCDDPREWAYAEMIRFDEPYYCMRSRDWKIIFDGDRHPIVAFDLENDPGEFDNVLESDRREDVAAVVADARRELLANFTA